MSSEPFDDDDFLIDGEDETFIERLLSYNPAIMELPATSDGIFNSLNDIAQFVNETYGQSGMYSLLSAVESQTGWSLEILGSKSEMEKILFDYYGIFDDDAWLKARNSHYWDMMVQDVYQTSAMWQSVVIASIAGKKPPLNIRIKRAWRVLTSKF